MAELVDPVLQTSNDHQCNEWGSNALSFASEGRVDNSLIERPTMISAQPKPHTEPFYLVPNTSVSITD